MTNIRLPIHTILLDYEDGRTGIPVKIACTSKEILPAVIDKNRIWWERQGTLTEVHKIVRWRIEGTDYPYSVTEEQYENLLSGCDVVVDDEEPYRWLNINP